LETQMKQRCYYVREIETMIPGRDSQWVRCTKNGDGQSKVA
jgi:hypothetical protein